MPEAVIVSAARSPIGRANKGSLKDFRPDDLSALIIKAALDKVPELDPTDDQRPHARLRPPRRRGRQQHGPRGGHAARVRRDPRHHDHPLLLLLGADLPDGLPRDQGRRGRRLHLRRRRDRLALREGHLGPHPRHPQPDVRGGRGAHRGARAGRPGLARPARGRQAPGHLHRDGPDGRERRPDARPRPQGARRVRRPQPEPRREGDQRRLLGQRDHPGHHARRHRGHRRRRPARRRHLRGDLRAEAGVPSRRRRHRRQLLRRSTTARPR